MLNEKQLRDVLVLAFQHLKQQNQTLHSMMAEIASVRDTLIEIGPKYTDVLSQHRARHAAAGKSSAFDDFQRFDATIQQLKAN